jgi:hypothetical protein
VCLLPAVDRQVVLLLNISRKELPKPVDQPISSPK